MTPSFPILPGEWVIRSEAISQLAANFVNLASDSCLRAAQLGGDLGLLHMVSPFHQRDCLLPGEQAFDDLDCHFKRGRGQCLPLRVRFFGFVFTAQLSLYASEHHAAAEIVGVLV